MSARNRRVPLRAVTERKERRGRVVGRAIALVAVAALVGLLAFGLTTKAPRLGIDQRLAAGRPAAVPGFDLRVLARGRVGPRLSGVVGRALRDGRVNSRELRGTPYVLNFWASWCQPCRVEAPRLERRWREGRKRGLLFLGLNQQDLIGDATKFIREFGQSYLNIRDPQNDVAIRWGVTGLPETFFITARGQIVDHVIGAISDEQLAAGIRAIETQRPRAASRGGATFSR